MRTNSDQFIKEINVLAGKVDTAKTEIEALGQYNLKNNTILSENEKDALIVRLGDPEYKDAAKKILMEKYNLSVEEIMQEVEDRVNNIFNGIFK